MAKKEKNKGAVYNNMLAGENAKEHFLTLCMMYENTGKILALQAKVIKHVQFSKTTLPLLMENQLNQYHEMGEEMKNLGASLDLLGGKPVLKTKKETFVSNIDPEDN